MKLINQKPAFFQPIYTASPVGEYPIRGIIDSVILDPLLTPVGNNAVVVIDDLQTCMNRDDLYELLLKGFHSVLHPDEDSALRDLFRQGMIYYDPQAKLPFTELFAIQAALKEHLPLPSAMVIYTPKEDVLVSAKELLAQKADPDKFFASLAFCFHPETLGFYFVDEYEFDCFKTDFSSFVQTVSSQLEPSVMAKCHDFLTISLSGLTESLILRQTDNDDLQEFSFSRILISALMNYAAKHTRMGILPFHAAELFCPRSVVLVNVEAHARATSTAIKNEWNMISTAIAFPIRIISKSGISRLTTVVRSGSRINVPSNSHGMQGPASKSSYVPFQKKELSVSSMIRRVSRTISRMGTVLRSQNAVKCVKKTYARPSRRDPDNFNLQGKMSSMKYKPDIHIYLDTSGSISESNYQEGIQALIVLARKLNVSLYFNSFSDSISSATRLDIQDKSVKQIYRSFQKVPKVGGGTDYEQVWNYIMASSKRQKELSLIMTDFEYFPRNAKVIHPENLYYLPISNTYWAGLCRAAENFCDAMARYIEPDIRKRLLF